jgi:hypothetical protein
MYYVRRVRQLKRLRDSTKELYTFATLRVVINRVLIRADYTISVHLRELRETDRVETDFKHGLRS